MAESLRVLMAAQGDNVKLSWLGPDQYSRVYSVNRDRLRKASQGVRRVLESAANAYISHQSSYEPFLPALADAGEKLRGAIFSSADNDSSAEDVLLYLDSLPKGTPLTIYSDSTVQIPWNFVYAGDARQVQAAVGNLTDFSTFWLSFFKIRIRFVQTQAAPNRPISRHQIKTLLALHNDRFLAATKALAQYPEIYPELAKKIERLWEYKLGPVEDWQACRDKWDLMSDEDSIVYIFAHSDGERLYLKGNPNESLDEIETHKYALDTNGFSVIFKKRHNVKTSNTLCFINGCRTADGDWGNGFLSITSGRGFQGFIGSEAEISNDWATRYAVEFLYALLEEGKSVDEAFEQTQTRCFPMSLWYSCYAHPDFRVSD